MRARLDDSDDVRDDIGVRDAYGEYVEIRRDGFCFIGVRSHLTEAADNGRFEIVTYDGETIHAPTLVAGIAEAGGLSEVSCHEETVPYGQAVIMHDEVGEEFWGQVSAEQGDNQ